MLFYLKLLEPEIGPSGKVPSTQFGHSCLTVAVVIPTGVYYPSTLRLLVRILPKAMTQTRFPIRAQYLRTSTRRTLRDCRFS